MITVEQALEILSKHPWQVKEQLINLENSYGYLLKEDLHADRDFPPFDRVSMDGIAIRYDDYQSGIRTFPIAYLQAAGSPQSIHHTGESCVEVMTGAVLPTGVDTVIRYEDLRIDQGTAEVLADQIEKGQNVHVRGFDRKRDDILVHSNTWLTSAEIGVAATIGKSKIKVVEMPRVLIVSTGDELVPVDQEPLPHQIRSSNAAMLRSALLARGIRAESSHLVDNEKVMSGKIKEWITEFEVMILLGGSSKGKYDYVPSSLKKLGVQEHFYRIKQRPGKPLWFGSKDNSFFAFALPGNPVSCFMCFEKYFNFWLNKSLGLTKMPLTAILRSDFRFEPKLTYFLQVQLHVEQESLYGDPVVGHGSGDLANLTRADAFMELPANQTDFKAGTSFPLMVYRETFYK
ncbi:MAG: molybdopterin molybdotransferase MoeA [Saprospiraceae bacterium]|nr:molybdopterin molybdotransferase MoeA [Saprospiraceae bacterium]